MDIVVSGGTGFIGQALVKKLLESENNLTIINRSGQNPFKSRQVNVVKYDGTYQSLNTLPKKVDLVIHLATLYLSVHSTEDVSILINSNVTFGAHLLEYMRANAVQNIISVSTYAQRTSRPDGYAQNLYSATKAAFEKILEFYAQTFSMKAIIFEMYDVYGPNDNRNKFIDLVLNAAKNNQSLNMSLGGQEICYIYIDDVVDAFLKAFNLFAEMGKGNIKHYSICGKQILILLDLIQLISKVINKKIVTNIGFYPYRANEIMKVTPSHPRLPGWDQKVLLEAGISILWNDLNS